MIKFYTTPNFELYLPYIIFSIQKLDKYKQLIIRVRKRIRGVIIDVGVLWFMGNAREYPVNPTHLARKLITTKDLFRRMGIKNIHIVVPDYPDHLNPKQLWVSRRITNIERTVANIYFILDEFPNEPWIIPIQTHYMKPNTVLRSIALLERFGILDKWDYFAVSLSMKDSHDVKTIKLAKQSVGNRKLHGFGTLISTLEKTHNLLYSSDKSIGESKNLRFRGNMKQILRYFSEDELPKSKKEIHQILELDNTSKIRKKHETLMSLYGTIAMMFRRGISLDGFNEKNAVEGFLFLLNLVIDGKKINYSSLIRELNTIYPLVTL